MISTVLFFVSPRKTSTRAVFLSALCTAGRLLGRSAGKSLCQTVRWLCVFEIWHRWPGTTRSNRRCRTKRTTIRPIIRQVNLGISIFFVFTSSSFSLSLWLPLYSASRHPFLFRCDDAEPTTQTIQKPNCIKYILFLYEQKPFMD